MLSALTNIIKRLFNLYFVNRPPECRLVLGANNFHHLRIDIRQLYRCRTILVIQRSVHPACRIYGTAGKNFNLVGEVVL